MAINENSLKNLKPTKKGELSTERAKILGSKGGKKTGEVKKQKRLMSQIYADFLAKKHNVTLFDMNQKDFVKLEDVTSDEYLGKVMNNILSRADSSSVGILKEIAERTEGSKVSLVDSEGKPLMTQKVIFEVVDPKQNGNKKRNKGNKSKNT